jgi:hypothetical protein
MIALKGSSRSPEGAFQGEKGIFENGARQSVGKTLNILMKKQTRGRTKTDLGLRCLMLCQLVPVRLSVMLHYKNWVFGNCQESHTDHP